MAIHLNSRFVEESIKCAVQLACYSNPEKAMQILQPLCLSDAQSRKVLVLIQSANAFTNIPDLQERVVSVLTCTVMPAFILQMLDDVEDMQSEFLSKLNIKDIIIYSCACKRLNQSIQGDKFFRTLFCRDFQDDYPIPDSKFYSAYKKCYTAQFNFQNVVFSKRAFEKENLNIRAFGGGEGFYTSTGDGEICIWDFEAKNRVKIAQRDKKSTRALKLFNGKFYSGRQDGSIEVLDQKSGNCLAVFEGHRVQEDKRCAVMALAFDDGLLYSGSTDETIKVLDLETGECLNTFEEHTGGIRALAFGNGVLCSASSNGEIKVWDPKNGKCLHTLRKTGNIVSSLIFLKGVLYSGDFNGLICAWDPVKGGDPLNTICISLGSIVALTSFNGNLCAAFSGGSIYVFNPAEQGMELYTFKLQRGLSTHGTSLVSFNEKICVATSYENDGVIHIWDFMEEDIVIFKELADLLRSHDDNAIGEAMERFSKMPAKAKNKIYECCGIAASSDDDKIQQWVVRLPQERAAGIEKYIELQKK